jgi:hypothetical protein
MAGRRKLTGKSDEVFENERTAWAQVKDRLPGSKDFDPILWTQWLLASSAASLQIKSHAAAVNRRFVTSQVIDRD